MWCRDKRIVEDPSVLTITELLEPTPSPLWRIVKQAGVDQVVSLLDGAEQQWRWPKAGAQHLVPGRYVAPPKGERPWERPAIEGFKNSTGLMGSKSPLSRTRLPWTTSASAVPAVTNRSSGSVPNSGPWASSAYPPSATTGWPSRAGRARLFRYLSGAVPFPVDMTTRSCARRPPLVEPGSITHDQLWEAYEYFLRAVVPVAEEAGVRISLHPDDPPIPRGPWRAPDNGLT